MTIALRVWSGAAAMLVTICVVAGLMLLEFQQSEDARSVVFRGHEVLAAMTGVLSALDQAESGQRGFLLTGRDDYLRPYDEAAAGLDERFAAFRARAVGDDEMERQIAAMQTLAASKLAELDETIRLRRVDGVGAAIGVMQSGQDAGLSDRIHQAAQQMRRHEDELLARARSTQSLLRQHLHRMVILGGPLAGIAILFAAYSLVRSIRRSLAQILEGIRHVGMGDFTEALEVPGHTEFAPIVEAFNQMTGRLGHERETRLAAEQGLAAANAELLQRSRMLEERSRSIEGLSRMTHRMQSCRSEAELAEVVRCFMPQILPEVPGTLYVMSNSQNLLRAVAEWNGDAAASRGEFAPVDCWGLRRGQPHLSGRTGADIVCPHVDPARAASYGCVPLVAQGGTVGLLYLQPSAAREPGESFGIALRDIEVVAENIALALANLRLRESLRNQSIRDPLTDLFNRRYLQESLELDIARALRSKTPLACIMLDVDRFKQFNDTFGHEAGDAVLHQIGRLLRSHVRGGDVACRYGGEEFTLLLPGATLAEARERAEDIRRAAKALSITHNGRPLGPVTLSLGVAVYPTHGDTAEALLGAADAALLRAKTDGRDIVVAAEPARQPAAVEKEKEENVPSGGVAA